MFLLEIFDEFSSRWFKLYYVSVVFAVSPRHLFVLQQSLEGLKAMGAIDFLEDHIFDHLSTRAEKLSCAYRALAVAEHSRQQGFQKLCEKTQMHSDFA